MTVTRWAGKQYTCLNADTKPTSNPSIVNARLFETDTGRIFTNSGNEWETFQSNNKTETFGNKSIDSNANTIGNLAIANPFNVRSGSILQSVSTADSMVGCMKNLSVLDDGINTPKLVFVDSTEGFAHEFLTEISGLLGLASDGTDNNLVTRRDYSPFFKCRLKVADTSGIVLYVGFTSASAISNDDTPLGNSDHGVIWGFRSTDSNFSVFNNDGTDTEVVNSMGIPKDGYFHTISFTFSPSNVLVVMDDGAGAKTQNLSTRIPGGSTDIKLSIVMGKA
jgi:hypothetical protein